MKQTCPRMLLFVLLLVLAGAVPAGAADAFKIVVVVNGTPITKYDVDEQMELVEKSMAARGQQMSPSELQGFLASERPKIIETMIEEQLMEEEIDRLGLTVEPKQVDAYIANIMKESNISTTEEFEESLSVMGVTMEEFRKKISKDMLKNRLVQGMVGAKLVITDSEIDEAFAQDPDFDGGMRVHLRAIIVPSQEEMEVVLDSIEDGTSFEDTARTLSKGPVPEEGGDMGLMALINLAPAWQAALEGVEPGELTEPFESEGSHVLLQLVETSTMHADDVPGMRDKLFNKLRQEKMSVLFDEYMGRLREMAVIEWK